MLATIPDLQLAFALFCTDPDVREHIHNVGDMKRPPGHRLPSSNDFFATMDAKRVQLLQKSWDRYEPKLSNQVFQDARVRAEARARQMIGFLPKSELPIPTKDRAPNLHGRCIKCDHTLVAFSRAKADIGVSCSVCQVPDTTIVARFPMLTDELLIQEIRHDL